MLNKSGKRKEVSSECNQFENLGPTYQAVILFCFSQRDDRAVSFIQDKTPEPTTFERLKKQL